MSILRVRRVSGIKHRTNVKIKDVWDRWSQLSYI